MYNKIVGLGGVKKGYHKMPNGTIMKNSDHYMGLGGIKPKKKKKLYEVYFNNNPSQQFDRISAYSMKEAKQFMREFYPKMKVTGAKLLG